ncbi:MAG: sugar ABC transporter permease [Spirochaetia bacterium]|jgi:multiple sugar transport system permease protein/N,N'-diacetylchitobiose transport system permease protein
MTELRRQGLSEQSFAFLILLPAAVVIFGVVLFPLVTTFIYSLQNMELISAEKGKFLGLLNYLRVLRSEWFWQALGRTLYFTLVSLTVETVLGLLIALLLNTRFIGVGFLRVLIIVPWATPGIVTASIWKWIYNPEYGVLNAVLTRLHVLDQYRSWLSDPFLAMNMVILADVWKMTPFAIIFFLAALQFINKSLYEAAKVDGAGVFSRFWHITLPYLVPTLAVVVVMRTMEKFKAFDVFYVMTRGGPANGTKVLVYEAYLKAFTNLQYSISSTLSYLIAVIVLAFTVVYVRLMKRGEAGDS